MSSSNNVNLKKHQIDEIIRCGKDPAYFFNRYCKIQHPVRGTIPFKTFPFQDDCVKEFNEHRFNIVLKSRQLGLSTLVAAYSVWMTIFHRDQNILIIATKLKVAQNLMNKIKTIIKFLPSWLMITKDVISNRQEIQFSNGSSVKAVPTSDDAGRSEALSLLIVDEAAHIDNFSELWMGLYSTLSTGGRAIILSTPNGVGNKFHELYVDAESNLNDFNPIKLLWTVHPERDQAWFDAEYRNLGPREAAQELLCEFLASGNTYINADDIAWVGSNVIPPLFKREDGFNLWIWEPVDANSRYLITADISRGDSDDFSTFHIFKPTGVVVGEYKGKIRPDRFAELLAKIGLEYNTARICPENNTFGFAVCMKLTEIGYPNLHMHDQHFSYTDKFNPPTEEITKIGFSTTASNRTKILSRMEEVIRNKKIIIHSSRFYDEIKTFIWQGDKAEAMKGKNDDLIMSFAIGSWLHDTAGGQQESAELTARMMLAAMVRTSTAYTEEPIRGTGTQHGLSPSRMILGSEPSGKMSRNFRDSRYAKEFSWLLSDGSNKNLKK